MFAKVALPRFAIPAYERMQVRGDRSVRQSFCLWRSPRCSEGAGLIQEAEELQRELIASASSQPRPPSATSSCAAIDIAKVIERRPWPSYEERMAVSSPTGRLEPSRELFAERSCS